MTSVCVPARTVVEWYTVWYGSLNSDPERGSSSSLSSLAAPSPGPLALMSKLQSSFKNKEPLRPIQWSRRTPRRQCVTSSTLTLSWLIPFSFSSYFCLFMYIFFLTNALTFREFSQLFPVLLPVFVYIFPHYSFFFLLPVCCFVFLFLRHDFYGDSVFPRNNGGWGIRRREGGWMVFS